VHKYKNKYKNVFFIRFIQLKYPRCPVSQVQNINETNIEFIFYPSISIRINTHRQINVNGSKCREYNVQKNRK
jgi:hypothetical protein